MQLSSKECLRTLDGFSLDAMQGGFGNRFGDDSRIRSQLLLPLLLLHACNKETRLIIRLSVLWEDHSGAPPHNDDLSCPSCRPLLRASSLPGHHLSMLHTRSNTDEQPYIYTQYAQSSGLGG